MARKIIVDAEFILEAVYTKLRQEGYAVTETPASLDLELTLTVEPDKRDSLEDRISHLYDVMAQFEDAVADRLERLEAGQERWDARGPASPPSAARAAYVPAGGVSIHSGPIVPPPAGGMITAEEADMRAAMQRERDANAAALVAANIQSTALQTDMHSEFPPNLKR